MPPVHRSRQEGATSDNTIMQFLSYSYPSTYVSVIGRHFTLDPVSENIQDIPLLLNSIPAIVVVVALPLIALIAAMVTHERQRGSGFLCQWERKEIPSSSSSFQSR